MSQADKEREKIIKQRSKRTTLEKRTRKRTSPSGDNSSSTEKSPKGQTEPEQEKHGDKKS